jgi:hypothetical protein
VSAWPGGWPELIAYVVSSDPRTARLTKLMTHAIVALMIVGATAVTIVALTTEKTSPLQLGVVSVGATTGTATVVWLRRWLRRRTSLPAEKPVRGQASDQHDGRGGENGESSEYGDEDIARAGGKDTGSAVVESGKRTGRRKGRRHRGAGPKRRQ